MRKSPERYKRMAATVSALCLAIILPALSQANSDNSAPVPLLLPGGPIGAATSPQSRNNPMIQNVAVLMPPQVIPVPIYHPAPGGVAANTKKADEPAANPEELTPAEIGKIRQVIEPGHSTATQVALVNIAVKGTSLLMYFIVWLVGLCIFRYVFNRWFDEDVYTQTWPSVVVITTMILCTAWVLVSTVQ